MCMRAWARHRTRVYGRVWGCVQEYLASHPFVIPMDFWLSHRAYEAANTYAINIDDVISAMRVQYTLWF